MAAKPKRFRAVRMGIRFMSCNELGTHLILIASFAPFASFECFPLGCAVLRYALSRRVQTDCESSWSGRTHWTDDSVDLRTRLDQIDQNGIAGDNLFSLPAASRADTLRYTRGGRPAGTARRRSRCSASRRAAGRCRARQLDEIIGRRRTGCHGPVGLSLHSIVMGRPRSSCPPPSTG